MNRSEILKQINRNVERLSAFDASDYQYIPLHQKGSPSVEALREVMRIVRSVVFPGFFDDVVQTTPQAFRNHIGVNLERLYDLLQEQIFHGLCFESPSCGETKQQSSAIAIAFINTLPEIKRLLSTDVKAMLDGDPAAGSASEVIFCYPAISAILHQRIAHTLLKLGVPVVPRIITEMAHSATGIDIHPGAQIGEYFAIDHGTGVVIGGTAIIGNRVRLYQGVTLGAKSFSYDEEGLPMNIPRHPIIEDNVVIYSNASVLGRITIGHDSVIGGNIWLTHDVPPYSKVLQSTAVNNR